MKEKTQKTILIFCLYKLWRIFRFCLFVVIDAATEPKTKRSPTLNEIIFDEKNMVADIYEYKNKSFIE